MSKPSSIALFLVCGVLGCGGPAGDDVIGGGDGKEDGFSLAPLTVFARIGYLRKAAVWFPTEIESMDLYNGPLEKDAFTPSQAVICRFADPTSENLPNGGKTAKFPCNIEKGDSIDALKIKYGRKDIRGENGEIYAEVMSSRLLWALGFGADRMYPLRVICLDCPKDPWLAYKDYPIPYLGTRVPVSQYSHAITERKYGGKKMVLCKQIVDNKCVEEVSPEEEGWGFDEVDRIRKTLTGDAKTQWEALKLLGAFIYDSDAKVANQRLVCLKGGIGADGKCSKPFIMIHDGGVTFGGGSYDLLGKSLIFHKALVKTWAEKEVWEDRSKCQARLDSKNTLRDPFVTEEGRQFLASLMNRLSDQQIEDIFRAARVMERNERISIDDLIELFPDEDFSPARLAHLFREQPVGYEFTVNTEFTVNAGVWAIAFKAKRAQLNLPCGSR